MKNLIKKNCYVLIQLIMFLLYGCGKAPDKPAHKIVVVDMRDAANATIFRQEFVEALRLQFSATQTPSVEFVACQYGIRVQSDCAKEALMLSPSLIYATTTTIAKEIRLLNKTIPMIFSGIYDPRATGLIDDLKRPEKNMTGFVSYAETAIKRLEIISQVSEKNKRIGILVDQLDAANKIENELNDASLRLGIKTTAFLIPFQSNSKKTKKIICDSKMDAFSFETNVSLRAHYKQIIEALNDCGKAAIFMHRDFVIAGGLMSYGPEDFNYATKAAEYIYRSTNTTNLGDIPIELPTKFVFALNRAAAQKLSVPLPVSILNRASEYH
jgi:putative tryptophan/tyrosine transport system substrate-binding protein